MSLLAKDKNSSEECFVTGYAPLFYVPCTILGQLFSVMLDTGASENFIGLETVDCLGCVQHPMRCPSPVRVELLVSHFVRLGLHFSKDFTVCLTFRVLPGIPEVVLGMPFLVRFEPSFSWLNRQMRLENKGKVVFVQGTSAPFVPHNYNPVGLGEMMRKRHRNIVFVSNVSNGFNCDSCF